jgi:hypothetical protein
MRLMSGFRAIADIRRRRHSRVVANETNRLQTGDRLQLSGGYDFEPAWLSGRASVEGTVAEFIPGQNETPAAVLKLYEPITTEGVTGDVLVLELRYVGATWEGTGTVHIELCDFAPGPKRWQDRRHGKWVESHASYQRLAR